MIPYEDRSICNFIDRLEHDLEILSMMSEGSRITQKQFDFIQMKVKKFSGRMSTLYALLTSQEPKCQMCNDPSLEYSNTTKPVCVGHRQKSLEVKS